MKSLKFKGQSMMELVFGVGMVIIVVGAIVMVTLSSLRNTQFSKNQAVATQLAKQYLEKVRTIKNSNFGICLMGEEDTDCSRWEDIWLLPTPLFGTIAGGCITNATGCTFSMASCKVTGSVANEPLCLVYTGESSGKIDVSGYPPFTYRIVLEDEVVGQKRVTSEVFWSDTSGEHSSKLVTVLGKI